MKTQIKRFSFKKQNDIAEQIEILLKNGLSPINIAIQLHDIGYELEDVLCLSKNLAIIAEKSAE